MFQERLIARALCNDFEMFAQLLCRFQFDVVFGVWVTQSSDYTPKRVHLCRIVQMCGHFLCYNLSCSRNTASVDDFRLYTKDHAKDFGEILRLDKTSAIKNRISHKT